MSHGYDEHLTERVSTAMPAWLVVRLDDLCRERRQSRSQLIRVALEELLAKPKSSPNDAHPLLRAAR